MSFEAIYTGTSRVVSSILVPFHGIFYCYDIPRYIVILSILVSSRKYRGIAGIAQHYPAVLKMCVSILTNLPFFSGDRNCAEPQENVL